MNICLVISCHLRTYKETYQNLYANIIDVLKEAGHTVNIVVNTYDTVSNSNRSWWMDDKLYEQYKPLATTCINRKKILKYYPNAFINIEKQGIPENTGHMDLWHVLQAYTSSSNGLRMAQEQFKPDWVLLTRGDINYSSKLNLSEINDSLLLADHGYFLKKGSCSDIWIAGKPDVVRKSLDMCLSENWVKYTEQKSHHFEDMYNEYLHTNGIIPQISNIKWSIKRLVGNDFIPESYGKYHYRKDLTNYQPTAKDIIQDLVNKCLEIYPEKKEEIERLAAIPNTAQLRAWIQLARKGV